MSLGNIDRAILTTHWSSEQDQKYGEELHKVSKNVLIYSTAGQCSDPEVLEFACLFVLFFLSAHRSSWAAISQAIQLCSVERALGPHLYSQREHVKKWTDHDWIRSWGTLGSKDSFLHGGWLEETDARLPLLYPGESSASLYVWSERTSNRLAQGLNKSD